MLGRNMVDRVTGFSGVVMGKAEYLTGCNQALLVPRIDEKGGYRPGEWFDVERLEFVGVDRLDLGPAHGHDREAPKR